MNGPFSLRATDGATVTLERYPILLGRATPGGAVPDVDVSHLDPQEGVDNRHCELFLDEGGVEVHDLGGVSGTWVDGRRLAPGGRAVLPIGGTLRVAGVQLTLVQATARVAPTAPPLSMSPTLGEWRDPGASRGVPLPPSASSAIPPIPIETPRVSGLDLTGAPRLARPLLESGADAVRLVEGFPVEGRRNGVFSSQQDPLRLGEIEDAVRTVRRALDLSDDHCTGWGYVGDLQLDFITPPLVERPVVGVVVSRAVEIGQEVLAGVEKVVSAGGAVLLAARRPQLAMRAIADALQGSATRPRAFRGRGAGGWTPSAWADLVAGAEGALEVALKGDPLLVIDPGSADLATLLGALPRADGGTVLGIDTASAEAALEMCARALPEASEEHYIARVMRRQEVARQLPWALSCESGRWLMRGVAIKASGGWSLEDEPGEAI